MLRDEVVGREALAAEREKMKVAMAEARAAGVADGEVKAMSDVAKTTAQLNKEVK